MRRRALATSGWQRWAYELHLTPEWEEDEFHGLYVDMYGDWSKVFELLTRMSQTIGSTEEDGYTSLYEIPEEVNITVDGERLSFVGKASFNDYFELEFGDDYCWGDFHPTSLYLYKN